jgi:hypothetical protein
MWCFGDRGNIYRALQLCFEHLLSTLNKRNFQFSQFDNIYYSSTSLCLFSPLFVNILIFTSHVFFFILSFFFLRISPNYLSIFHPPPQISLYLPCCQGGGVQFVISTCSNPTNWEYVISTIKDNY